MKIFLESKRLILREFVQEDFGLLYYLDSDPAVLKFIGLPKTKKESEIRLEKALQDYKNKNGLGKWMCIEKASKKKIGWFVLNYLDSTQLVEIGYRLKEEYWGKGYATEMSKTLLSYGFNTLELDKIVGVTHLKNEASKRVLTKIGLKYLGERHFYNLDVCYFEKEREV